MTVIAGLAKRYLNNGAGGFASVNVGTGNNDAFFHFVYDRQGCAGQPGPTLAMAW